MFSIESSGVIGPDFYHSVAAKYFDDCEEEDVDFFDGDMVSK
jgi:hypothetical protein